MTTKLTPRTKAALALLPSCVGHDDKADAIAEAFAIVDRAVEYDAGHLPTEAQRQSLYGFKTLLDELEAEDYLSGLRVIKRLKEQAAGALVAGQTEAKATFNERTSKLAILQLEGRVNAASATIQQQGWDLANAHQRIEELEDFIKRFFDWGDAMVFDSEDDPLIQLIDEAGTLTLDKPTKTELDNPDEML